MRVQPKQSGIPCQSKTISAGLEGREDRQLDQAEKERRADHVIRNDASLEELESVVSQLMDQLRSEASVSLSFWM